jgi:hypothetical protein
MPQVRFADSSIERERPEKLWSSGFVAGLRRLGLEGIESLEGLRPCLAPDLGLRFLEELGESGRERGVEGSRKENRTGGERTESPHWEPLGEF